MAILNFIPEIWAATLQSSLKKALVYGGVCNRQYEGQIQNAGDTVRITSISRPTIATYTRNSTSITPENLTDAARSLVIDQSKYFAFEVDDLDKRQAANGGALLTEAAMEAAYGLADTADQYIAGLFGDIDTDNEITTTSITTSALAVTGMANLMVKLDEKNVPRGGRWVVIPPWYHALLVQSTSFLSLADSGSTEALRNGTVGRIFGFDVLVSNNCVNVTGDDWRVVAGYSGAVTFAEQIRQVEAYRPESAFSDAIKGLHLYGAKITRPDGLATLVASIT